MLFLIPLLLFLACASDDTFDESLEYDIGKNHYLVEVDGVEREFYVHVPSTYSSQESYPVVFMLHGSSGNGDKFYRISGWKELGEKEGIISVYPSSGRYCVIDDGEQKNTTKWNTYRDWVYCEGETPLDDIAFFRKITNLLKTTFEVDEDRFYMAGFSNGGRMAANCVVELSDVFAAITQNSGSFSPDSIYFPEIKRPTILQFGNSENGFLEMNNGIPYPLKDMELLVDHPHVGGIINTHINTLDLSNDYTLEDIPGSQACLVYKGNSNPELEFRFCLIKDMGHNYPNGTNHPFKGAEHQWEWFRQF